MKGGYYLHKGGYNHAKYEYTTPHFLILDAYYNYGKLYELIFSNRDKS